ncbi:MAG TPA: DUF2125 domain-containing protein, partial [Devosia sp.]|nr:DUF2125 domain-containing protein [Devosia sp.]
MKKIIALFVVVVLVVGGWSGFWLWGASQIRAQIAALGGADGETAPKVTCGRTSVSGFPFRFDVECAEVTIVDRDVTTKIPAIRASVLAYHPTQVIFSSLGPVTIADAYTGGAWRIDYTAQSGGATLHTDDIFKGITGEGWRIGRISVIAENLKLTDTVLGEKPLVNAATAQIQIIDMPDRLNVTAGTAALAGYTEFTGISAPDYGVADGRFTAETELTGLPADIRNYNETLPAFFAANQGELKLVSLRGAAGEDFVESTGAIKLVQGANLDGTISLKSKGLVERLGAAVPENLKVLLVGQPDADGSYSQTLNIKGGVVFIGAAAWRLSHGHSL